MSQRFVDRKDLKKLIKQSKDFNVRNHLPLGVWLIFGLIMLIIGGIVYFNRLAYGVDDSHFTSPLIEGYYSILFLLTICMVLSGILLLSIVKLNKFLAGVEFQSALFSSSLRVHTVFSCIVNEKHAIVYADNNLRKIMSNGKISSLSDILGCEGFSLEDKGKVIQAVAEGRSEEVPFSFKDSSGKKQGAMVVIDPLDKPKGYFIIRGY